MKSVMIEGRKVGDGAPCFIIAENALFHDGSLGSALAFIDAAATAGADAVKFQTHLAEFESSSRETFRVPIFPQDKTRFDYWKRTSFSEDQWLLLKQRADQRNVVFLSTPFSIEAAQMLRRIGVKAWKIGSGETNNLPLLEELSKYHDPVLLSTGMSYMAEVDASVGLLKAKGVPLVLYQCTNKYPCPAEHIGLNLLSEYRGRYDIPVGLSDHSGKVGTGIAAVTLGAASLEVHLTWDRRCFGPDVSSSLTFDEFALMVREIRFIEKALANPVNKDAMAKEMEPTRSLFTKSIIASTAIKAGSPISEAALALRKPGTGIPAAEYKNIVGKTATRDIDAGEFLTWDDFR
jgi:N-acetylneuraminate synthase